MLSPASGNVGIRARHHSYLFHTRAGYDDEMRYIVDTTASTNGPPLVAIVRGSYPG